ncbi:ADP-ribosylglycohydrolase family protein [Pyxidicoccus sp. 3LG]
MLLATAVADAYAIPFEFVQNPRAHGLVNDLQTYQQHPRFDDLKPSQYTDDTLRSIATALVVINNDGPSVFDPTAYVTALQQVVSQDHRKGWSKRFQQYLEANLEASPVDFMRGLSRKAASNGAIMGCLPLGYLSNPVDVRLAATVQAITTHSVDTAVYAQMMALSAHFFIHNPSEDSARLMSFLLEEVEGGVLDELTIDSSLRPAPVDMSAKSTALAVLWLLSRSDSLSGILHEAVELGGDTDSVAALAVGIASCTKAYRHDLPEKLVNELDHGRGKQYLLSLDRKLREAGGR